MTDVPYKALLMAFGIVPPLFSGRERGNPLFFSYTGRLKNQSEPIPGRDVELCLRHGSTARALGKISSRIEKPKSRSEQSCSRH